MGRRYLDDNELEEQLQEAEQVFEATLVRDISADWISSESAAATVNKMLTEAKNIAEAMGIRGFDEQLDGDDEDQAHGSAGLSARPGEGIVLCVPVTIRAVSAAQAADLLAQVEEATGFYAGEAALADEMSEDIPF